MDAIFICGWYMDPHRIPLQSLIMLASLNFSSVKVTNSFGNFFALESDGKLSICLSHEDGHSSGDSVGKACLETNSHTIILREWGWE